MPRLLYDSLSLGLRHRVQVRLRNGYSHQSKGRGSRAMSVFASEAVFLMMQNSLAQASSSASYVYTSLLQGNLHLVMAKSAEAIRATFLKTIHSVIAYFTRSIQTGYFQVPLGEYSVSIPLSVLAGFSLLSIGLLLQNMARTKNVLPSESLKAEHATCSTADSAAATTVESPDKEQAGQPGKQRTPLVKLPPPPVFREELLWLLITATLVAPIYALIRLAL
ncbi:hypothetical protein CYMTET_39507 [Cymbomonas tetramitiformis]|uniref:Uncharacterized protein n=1 Tax=Cymbomonas tetramitiformis TaxID=36881 RepID=A0AAE0C9Y0_9CHLO|nr:hypothetical protein CYMTET_39507 [Cymbomonas tetramitiformis]